MLVFNIKLNILRPNIVDTHRQFATYNLTFNKSVVYIKTT